MKKPQVLFAVFEAVPFMKTGGLGDVGGSLPQALGKAGCTVRVILPKFATIPAGYRNKMRHLTDFTVSLGWRTLYCGIETLVHDGVTYYFVDNEYYFGRDKAYGFFDDGERIAFFSKAVVEAVQHLPKFSCDILHCHDWHTALAPVFLREFYRGIPLYEHIRTVFTVHNIKFQGKMSDFVLGDVLGLAGIPAAAGQLACGRGTINFMKGAVSYSDRLTTVSPTYAQEIKTPFYGEGLDEIFRRRDSVLSGILNGIDNEVFDPQNDSALPAPFHRGALAGKKRCKKALQKELGLKQDADAPLIVMIGRLTQQKGLDLLQRVCGELLDKNLQLAVLGTGDRCYEDMLQYFAGQHPDKMAVRLAFDEALSHRMYAGGDMLLMPSLFEPCGLAQMIAMRYGTLPIVRETGGLADSVVPYNDYTGEGNGFSFRNYNAHEMKDTILRGTELYSSEPTKWKRLANQAMAADFSWDGSAKEYLALYQQLLKERAEH